MPSARPPNIVVVGSLNIDYFIRVAAFPQPGETVMGSKLEIRFGGKGANQAVAAARLGADVSIVGCVGDDEMGRCYKERLGEFCIKGDGVRTVPGCATGSAFINIDAAGENTIVVAAGANAAVDGDLVSESAELIAGADALLLQNEVPHDANVEAARVAREGNTQVIYNPAPWDGQRDIGALGADWIVVNERESSQLPAGSCRRLVVTRGAASTLAEIDGRSYEVPTTAVEPLDTVGAGDTFSGVLSVRLAEGTPPVEAIAFANCSAAMATLKLGAQEAMPSRAEVAAFERRT